MSEYYSSCDTLLVSERSLAEGISERKNVLVESWRGGEGGSPQ